MSDPATRIRFISINQAFRNPLFRVLEREETPGIFQLTCGELRTVITIKVKKIEGSLLYSLDASHGIKPPKKAVYFLRYREYVSPGEALTDFQRVFARTYNKAVSKGYRASETWLVPDKGADLAASGLEGGPTAVPVAEGVKRSQPEGEQRSRKAKRPSHPRGSPRSPKHLAQTVLEPIKPDPLPQALVREPKVIPVNSAERTASGEAVRTAKSDQHMKPKSKRRK